MHDLVTYALLPLGTQWLVHPLSVAMDLASMAMAMWARAATMLLLFYQVAILQFTLWGIRVVHPQFSKFGAWRAAKLIMFSIHIVVIVVVLYSNQLYSGVNVTHKELVFQHLHRLHSRIYALLVVHAITAARSIVENALHLLAQAKAMLLLHPLLQAKAMLLHNHPFTMAYLLVLVAMVISAMLWASAMLCPDLPSMVHLMLLPHRLLAIQPLNPHLPKALTSVMA